LGLVSAVGGEVTGAVSVVAVGVEFSGSLLALWLTFNANSADIINVVLFISIITILKIR
jgi:hypothetical protein